MNSHKIIWKIVLIHLSFYLSVLCLHSCGMLKDTSKERSSLKEERSSKLESQEIDLSKVYRESKIYSYRPDGTVAAFEHRKEQIDSASLKKISNEKQLNRKLSQIQKQRSPAKIGVAAIIIVLCIMGFIIIKKHF